MIARRLAAAGGLLAMSAAMAAADSYEWRTLETVSPQRLAARTVPDHPGPAFAALAEAHSITLGRAVYTVTYWHVGRRLLTDEPHDFEPPRGRDTILVRCTQRDDRTAGTCVAPLRKP